jgi:hypothetical protein
MIAVFSNNKQQTCCWIIDAKFGSWFNSLHLWGKGWGRGLSKAPDHNHVRPKDDIYSNV